jgi:transketolase
MRNAFADEITKLALIDQRIILLSGDIGNRLFDNFKKLFPNRFYNCGVAESNMASMAAGLAKNGLIPITYTITPFNTIRCLEQIKIDICYHNLPVIIVGVGAGLSYGSLGGTHHACDDISLLRALPNINVVCPADAIEVRSLLNQVIKLNKPTYLRMGKKGEPLIHNNPINLKIGKAIEVKNGKDICIISTGNMVYESIKSANLLDNENINAKVINMHTVKPLDEDLLKDLCNSFSLLISIEEHSIIGGLGSSIAEWLIDNNIKNTSLFRIALPDKFIHPIGSQSYLREKLGLTDKKLTLKILNYLKKHENISSNIS